ncbi:Ger(x)C family spore germination protein [Clostridium sp. YIM B02505]|uniref:Ger(X)C family spore germination protein n=1 Tax=Clostridium yunnanense TaxID=2800325 RepID=A0ABS1EPC3_9CLOT|nr:Ger(x)C family spore germination protein [Clostridium yunnanense]MBK1811158.1 Ger(x)C family spore germination protein [Clostridium yunnanense]
MIRFKRITILFIFLSFTLIQTGCWDQKIFEDLGFILQLGVEQSENNKIIYTVSMPQIDPEAKEKIEVLTTTTNLMKEGQDKLRLESGRIVEGGKNQHLYFSSEIAQKGLDEFLESFLRSPENTLISNVIVVQGSPKELIENSRDYKDKPKPSFYVNDLLDDARNNSFTIESKIFKFSILSHSGTIDPTAPYVGFDKNQIKVLGSALFNGDKMVGKINNKQAGLLNALMGNKYGIHYIYKGQYSKRTDDNTKNGAVIEMKVKKRKVKINTKDNIADVNIDLKLKGSVSEYLGPMDLSNPKDKKKFEEDISKKINEDCLELLSYLAEIKSDPVGFGEILRSKHNEYWKSVNWKDEYKKATFNVNAKIDIEFFGAITNQ